MIKKSVLRFIAFAISLTLASTAHSELYDRGSGLIYDEVLDITWLQYANFAGSTMTWEDAMAWAAGLEYQGYDDWRLPDSDNCSGYDCTNSEMGHLFYAEGISSDVPDMFIDVRPYMYWSSTEYSSDPAQAFRFNFSSGSQGTSAKTYARYTWAVRDGDSSLPVVPEPVSTVLFITGGATMGIRRFLMKS